MHSARSACKKMNWKQRQGNENYLEWRRFRSRCWWLTVALVSRQPATVADVGSPSSLLCFDVLSSSSLFFCSPCQQCSCLSRWLRGGDVAGGGKEEDWWWYAKDAASVSLYFLLLPPAFCLCFSLLFIFFCSFFVHSPLSLSLLAFLSFSYSPLFTSLGFFSLFHYPSSLLLCSTLPLLLASVLLFQNSPLAVRSLLWLL